MQRRSRTTDYPILIVYAKYVAAQMRTHQLYYLSTIVIIFGSMCINIWVVLNLYFGTSRASQ